MLRRRRTLLVVLLALGAAAGLPPAAAASPGRSFTIAATGDVIIHRAISEAAAAHAPLPGGYDFRPLFRLIEPWIADADFAVCHLEGTLSPTNTGLLYQVADLHPAYFNGPHEVAAALAATGYDACSTAGNHALDRDLTGIRETLEVLDSAGIGHSGTARRPEERRPTLYRVNGVRVAHLAYTLGTNRPAPAEAPWAVNLIDTAAILADARRARDLGAEFTVVSLHWGTEYQAAPDAAQVSLAAALTASPDVDLILGHHTHLVQPIARVNGKVVVYGMGNVISNIRTNADGAKYGAEDGVIVHLAVTEGAGGGFSVTEVTVTATYVDDTTKRVLPVEHTLAFGAEPRPVAALEASRARTYHRLGIDRDGVTTASPTPWPSLVCAGRVATVVGTAGPDLLRGTPGNDVIVGRDGDDVILVGEGHDLVCGGAGDDAVQGGPGLDAVYGGPGDDLLSGQDGPDRLFGEEGGDHLAGGGEADALYGGRGDDALSGQGADDLLVAGPGRDWLWGGPGRDTLIGGADTLLFAEAEDSCRGGTPARACR